MGATGHPRGIVNPRYMEALEQCRELTLKHCTTTLTRMFNSSDEVLMSFADKAESNDIQTQFFDAIRELWLHQERFQESFRRELESVFLRFLDKQSDAAEKVSDTLSLVSQENFEQSLALRTIADKTESNCREALYALKKRLAVVNFGQPLEGDDIPGGPAQLAEVFEKSARVLEVPRRVRLVFFTLFDRFVLKDIHTLYDACNNQLVAAGILPTLRYEVNRPPPGAGGTRKASGEDAAAEQAAGEEQLSGDEYDSVDAPSEPIFESPLSEEIFSGIRELMATQRRQTARTGGGRPVPRSQVYTPTQLSGQIAEIETDVVEESPVSHLRHSSERRIEVDADLLVRVKDALKRQREIIIEKAGKERVAIADEDAINTVGMIFEQMLNEKDLPNVVKALLSHLHTPYLKVAIADRNFLNQSSHAARRLFDQMIDAGIKWVNENDLRSGAYPEIQRAIERVLSEYKNDISLFKEILEEFLASLGKVKEKAKVIEERTVEAERGRSSLQAAKQSASQAVQDVVDGKPVPEPVFRFLSEVWADHMTLILLRNPDKANPPQWQQALQVAQKLVALATMPETSSGQPAFLGQEIANLEKILREDLAAFIPHYLSRVDDLIMALRAPQKFAKTEAAGPPLRKPGRRKPDAGLPPPTAEETHAMEEIKKARPGTLFSIVPDGGSSPQHVKLAWFNPVTQHFLFVDQGGVKVAVRSLRQLASDVLKGDAQRVEAPKSPFVDRAMFAIRSTLEKSLGLSNKQEAS